MPSDDGQILRNLWSHRFFGQPPMRDVKALRATSTIAA
jgi:hypothetical protein